MDLSGEDIPGEDLLPLLRRAGGDALAAALTGTAFYTDDPEQAAPILSCDANRGMLSLAGPAGRPVNRALAQGYVLLTDPLRAAIHGQRTPADEAAERQQRTIAAFGFRKAVEAPDLHGLAAAIEAARACHMPLRDDRFEGLRLARKYGTAREIAKLAAGWLEAGTDPPPGEVLIHLVAALRALGRGEEALARTQILTRPANGLSDSERRILLVERGALWLDRFEITHDPQCLDLARRCAAQSWAISPSEECSALYQRLKPLERDHG